MDKYILLFLLIFLLAVFLYIRYGIRSQADNIHSQINQYIEKKQPSIQLKVYDVDEQKTKHFIIEEEGSVTEHFKNKTEH